MRPVPINVRTRFAEAFYSGRNGYSLLELYDLFLQYQMDVPTVNSNIIPTKKDYFVNCIGMMPPDNQRQFLYDLCDDPPTATGPLPDKTVRKKLLSL